MTTTKIAGRQGKIRVGCTCPPNTAHEQPLGVMDVQSTKQ